MPVAAELDEVPSVVEQEQSSPEQRPAATKRSNDIFLIEWIFMSNKSLPYHVSARYRPEKPFIYHPDGDVFYFSNRLVRARTTKENQWVHPYPHKGNRRTEPSVLTHKRYLDQAAWLRGFLSRPVRHSQDGDGGRDYRTQPGVLTPGMAPADDPL